MLNMPRQRLSGGRSALQRPDQSCDARLSEKNSPPDVASNLRRLRHQQGYSLETLSKRSGVSRAMLGQIETGKSLPTIALIWKVAKALGIPVTALIVDPIEPHSTVIIRGAAPTTLASYGHYRIRSFSGPETSQPFDFSEVHIAAGHRETVPPYSWGTRATLLVTGGTIEVEVGNEPASRLTDGAAILFDADIEHTFFNPATTDATAFLVVAPSRSGAR
ncbi:MAG: transcriptional regulator [Hyphomicrobium sp.]|nr:MAG: transcriptional regulator [Hyphomicrobium sp.]